MNRRIFGGENFDTSLTGILRQIPLISIESCG